MQDHKGLVVYYLWGGGGGGGSFAALSRHFKANPPKPFEVFQLDPPQQNNSGQKMTPTPPLSPELLKQPSRFSAVICESNPS